MKKKTNKLMREKLRKKIEVIESLSKSELLVFVMLAINIQGYFSLLWMKL